MNTQRTKQLIWSWYGGALCCFTAGIGTALLGSVLTALTWILRSSQHAWLRESGTALLIVTIPLLILAGYCMDWAEHNQNKPDNQGSGNTRQQRLSI